MTGLVLAGGQSHRMGTNKAMICYQSQPQYIVVAKYLEKYCQSVFISSKQLLDHSNNFIEDNIKYKSNGPIAGILSAFEKYQDNYFVVAIDYPFLQQYNLDALYNNYILQNTSVAMFNSQSNFYEPFIAIYTASFISQLSIENTIDNNFSLQKYLAANKIEKEIPTDLNSIKSIDTFAQYESIKNLMK